MKLETAAVSRAWNSNGKSGGADGIRCDEDGNIWASAGWVGEGYDGVHVFAPDGVRIGVILLPEICSNVCFGGAKRNRLFMTASHRSMRSMWRRGARTLLELTRLAAAPSERRRGRDRRRAGVCRARRVIASFIVKKTYAIGDIHGHAMSKLQQLVARCLKAAQRDSVDFVFLGDYVDRGPSSNEVVEYLLDLRSRHSVVCLSRQP